LATVTSQALKYDFVSMFIRL